MIGEILKKRREEQGKNLREIADNLKIRFDYLKALEDGAFDKLPADVYVKGYVQEYAKVLGMDPEAAVATYSQERSPSPPDQKSAPEKVVPPQGRRFKTAYILLPVILIVSGIIAAFQIRPAPKEPYKAAPIVEKVNPAPSAAVSDLVLEIAATDATWLLVTIDSANSKEILMQAGDSVKWHAKKGYSLKIGNAGGIRLVFNGRELPKLGEKGQVVKVNLPHAGT